MTRRPHLAGLALMMAPSSMARASIAKASMAQAWVALVLMMACASPVRAASPSGFNLQVPAPGSSLPVPPRPPPDGPPSAFQPAPLPNRDVELYVPRASTAPSVAPSLFTRPDQYRGDGFNKGSTAQAEQEKRLRPGAGFSLHMPLTGN